MKTKNVLIEKLPKTVQIWKFSTFVKSANLISYPKFVGNDEKLIFLVIQISSYYINIFNGK